MAKIIADVDFDAALASIATSTTLTFCSAQPSNYEGIEAVTLVQTSLTPGIGNGDYTKADGDVSGRKLVIASKLNLTPIANGTVIYAVLDDGTNLRGTTVTSQAVTTSQTWNSPSFKFELKDPT